MADYRKLERWADKLLDTGKRNNLINFRDAKGSTAEVLMPEAESIFGKCSVGRVFEVFDPKLPEEEIIAPEEQTEDSELPEDVTEDLEMPENVTDGDELSGQPLTEEMADSTETADSKAVVKHSGEAARKGLLTREEYREAYAPRMKNERYLLLYAKTSNPMATVKAIAKKAKEMQDETGINAAYLVFGFLRWREKESSQAFYEAPLLLVHVNLLTGAIKDPVKIEISDDDVVVNPTFRYLLEAEYGIHLPEFTDGEMLTEYYEKTAREVRRMGWEVVDACKLGIFSFLKLNMYEDLRRNADRILKNENIRALLGEAEEQPVHSAEETATSKMFETNAGYPETARSLNDRQRRTERSKTFETNAGYPETARSLNERQRRTERSEAFDQNPAAEDKPKASNPLIDLHTVVDADSSQIEAILMAKSGKSFVLQGPPGTGKSQTITNIIAECLHDGKKVLFVSEKQAALNVVFDKLKKAGLADFCLELHSHKANKRAVIDELCRTMETPKSSVSFGADEEIRQKANAQAQLDGYAFALHQKRENIEKSLYELFELYAGERNTPETAFVIEDIEKKGKEYFQAAVRALEQYAEYIPSVGKNYRENPWFGFADERISFAGRAQMKTDLAELSDGFGRLQEESALHQEKYRTLAMNQAAAKSWQEFLEFCGQSDVITPELLFGRTLEEALPQIWRLRDLAGELVPLRDRFLEKFNPSALGGLDGKTLYGRFIGEFGSFFSRMFSGDYRSLIASLQLHSKTGEKPSYERAVKYAEQLMKVQELQTAFDQAARPVQNLFGKCWQGPDTDWDHVLLEIQKLQKCHAERSACHLERIACHSERSEESPRNAYPEKISQTVERGICHSERSEESSRNAYPEKTSQTVERGICHSERSEESPRNAFPKELLKPLGALPDMTREEFFTAQPDFSRDADSLRIKLATIEAPLSRLRNQFSAATFDFEHEDFDACIQKTNACLADFERLGNWLGFMSVLEELDRLGLRAYVDHIIIEEILPEHTVGAYRRTFYKHWIEYLLFTVPELASFTRIRHEQAVAAFAKKDALQYEINKLRIRAELSKKRPNLEMVAGGSAVAILRREGSKKRKQMPIRRLLSETGSLVQILKPCFLMSPLSVSTFLDPDKITFDTVVFDEASQIFPQDAVGAAWRGKQLIVVGDSRQMPPSDFFRSFAEIEEDDEEVGDVGDFESILDVCSASLTTKLLAWHYRSHYEQLIAFSNRHFYNNRLVTFPSSTRDHKGIGVDYYYTEGIFDRRTKTNYAEAEAVVERVYQNIREYPERSLGVVAFSAAQQGLIDRLLQARRAGDPSYEWFFRADRPEPFFVKNLETVQGDERDTIIFSVAYAKDSQGRFLHNFGPLNREGGERRLNVAVTRAKDNVQLIASIHDTDIDLNRTNSEGARLLRAYLAYAEKGEQALEGAGSLNAYLSSDEKGEKAQEGTKKAASEAGEFSAFEEEVAEVLQDEGYLVDAGIGCSEQRIRLGLRTAEDDRYLLAIESDGENYRRAKNARDRDSLRQRVLENMGWQFCRIWSTEWYRNREVEKARLLAVAREATQKREKAVKVALANAFAEVASVDELAGKESKNAAAAAALAAASLEKSLKNPFEEGPSANVTALPSSIEIPEGTTNEAAPLKEALVNAPTEIDSAEGAAKSISIDLPVGNAPVEVLRDTGREVFFPGTNMEASSQNSSLMSSGRQPGLSNFAENASREASLFPGDEETEDLAEEAKARFEVKERKKESGFPQYRQVDAMAVLARKTFRTAIRDIMKVEAPLSEEFLLKRIVHAFGREKVTRVVVTEFDSRMAGCEKLGILRRNGFLYLQSKEEGSLRTLGDQQEVKLQEIRLRVPGDKREVKYIAIEELADGLYTLIRQNVTATRDGLYKTLANLLGFTRASEAMTARFEDALSLLKESGKVKEENGVLSVGEN